MMRCKCQLYKREILAVGILSRYKSSLMLLQSRLLCLNIPVDSLWYDDNFEL